MCGEDGEEKRVGRAATIGSTPSLTLRRSDAPHSPANFVVDLAGHFLCFVPANFFLHIVCDLLDRLFEEMPLVERADGVMEGLQLCLVFQNNPSWPSVVLDWCLRQNVGGLGAVDVCSGSEE